jgi:predicted nucleotidyltransferase
VDSNHPSPATDTVSPASNAAREAIIAAERERIARARIAAAAQRDAMDAAAREIAQRLGAAEPGITRVILFGSVVHTRGRTDRERPPRDIDLCVEGACSFSTLESLTQGYPWPIDIVPLDDLRPAVADHALAYGDVLYDKNG